jgi:hypothetical protein
MFLEGAEIDAEDQDEGQYVSDFQADGDTTKQQQTTEGSSTT